jgi:hypothetical protein
VAASSLLGERESKRRRKAQATIKYSLMAEPGYSTVHVSTDIKELTGPQKFRFMCSDPVSGTKNTRVARSSSLILLLPFILHFSTHERSINASHQTNNQLPCRQAMCPQTIIPGYLVPSKSISLVEVENIVS